MLLPIHVSSFQVSMLKKTSSYSIIFIYKKKQQEKYDTLERTHLYFRWYLCTVFKVYCMYRTFKCLIYNDSERPAMNILHTVLYIYIYIYIFVYIRLANESYRKNCVNDSEFYRSPKASPYESTH
jgi:hypothetical protein